MRRESKFRGKLRLEREQVKLWLCVIVQSVHSRAEIEIISDHFQYNPSTSSSSDQGSVKSMNELGESPVLPSQIKSAVRDVLELDFNLTRSVSCSLGFNFEVDF